MKKIILAIALIVSAWGAFAQLDNRPYLDQVWSRSRTDIRFEQPEAWINIRDVVHLKNRNKMIIELNNVGDYDYLRHLDELIAKFKDDIRFYQDSLNDIAPGNVRIDYSVTTDSTSFIDRVEIRFKRYPPNGDAFIKKNSEVAKLKLEQDTVNFILRVFAKNRHKSHISSTPYDYSIQASFFVNNYSDLFKLGDDKEFLNHTVDTLISTKKSGTVSSPYKFPSTTIYKPEIVEGKFRFIQSNGILKREDIYSWNKGINRSDKVQITLNMGAGLVRNTLTPMAEGGIGWYNMRPAYYTKKFQQDEINTFIGASVTPYFFFDRNPDGNFYVKDNWFVTLEMGGATNFLGLSSPLVTGGVGYLFAQKGNYFKGTTMKAFMNFKIRNGPTISPELILTGDLKQIFPGITVKIF
jgi:hypothetical protein